MTWLLVVSCIAWIALSVVGAREGHKRWEIRQAAKAARSVVGRHNRIAQLEIELGIVAPLYADADAVEQRWMNQFMADLGHGPPPLGFPREPTAEEQAAIEQTRARRKEVARTAAQKRSQHRTS